MRSPGLTILCYHRVLPESARDRDGRPYFLRGTAVTIPAFRAQITSLTERFQMVGEAEVICWLAGEHAFVRPACWLTFDDGYSDVLEHAAPILAELAAPATAFIATDVLDGSILPADRWYAVLNAARRRRGRLATEAGEWAFDLDRPDDYARMVDGPERRTYLASRGEARDRFIERLADALDAPIPNSSTELYLDRERIRSLAAAGWTIGSHTRSHAFLPMLSDGEVDAELRGSKEILSSIGVPVRSLAYPDGRWTTSVASRARSAGYDLALTLRPGVVNGERDVFALAREIAKAE